MMLGFKIATLVLVVLILAWSVLLINTVDAYAHIHYLVDKIEGIY